MKKPLLLITILFGTIIGNAQTYFYIGQIAVQPSNPISQDVVSIDLIGGLSSTGAYVVSASAMVTGFTVTISITAADPGGFTVIVPHTETVEVGTLMPGSYTIVINGQNVADFAPAPQHQFIVSGSGNTCDYLTIRSVQWHAFTDTAIIVHVTNIGGDIFDHPNFILYDANGDTLAKESVFPVGIAGDSWHILRVMNGASIPSTPFFGTLELWRSFTEELACSWALTFDLCPPPPCATLIPVIQNFGGGLSIGDYTWAIIDDNGPIAEGNFTMTESIQFDADTICLPPGNYRMYVTAQQPHTGGQPYYGVMIEGWISGPSQPVPFDVPVFLDIPFYTPCIDGTNAIGTIATPNELLMEQGPGTITIRDPSDSPLGLIRMLDMQGRILFEASTRSATRTIPTVDRPSGIYAITVISDVTGRHVLRSAIGR